MNSANHPPPSGRYSRHIGRIGALAVAMGVGMTLATSPGTAWADTGTEANSDGASSATDSATTATTATTDTTTTGNDEPPDTTASPSVTPTLPTGVTTPAGSTETSQTNTVAPDVIVRSSGGALTSDQYTDDAPTTPLAPPPDDADAGASQADGPAPTIPDVSATDGTAYAVVSKPSSTPSAVDTSVATMTSTPTITPTIEEEPVAPRPETMRMTTFAAAVPPPVLVPRPVDPITALWTVPATVISTVTGLVATILAPLLGPAPGTPAESPLIWTVLAFVRRQFFNDAPTVIPAVSAPDSLGNITISLPRIDGDGDPLVYTATNGAKGTVALNPDGHSFTYTPKAGEIGFDTLTVTANDATTDHVHGFAGLVNALSLGLFGDPGHTSTPTTVTVRLNTPPTSAVSPGAPDVATGAVTVTVVAKDPDGDPLTFTATAPAGGTGTVGTATLLDAATGTYTIVYTPSAGARHTAASDTATAAQKIDAFTLTISDGHGSTLTGTVGVSIAPDNDVPVFSTLTSTPGTDGKVTGTIVFTDGDSDALTYSGSTTTSKGSAVINADGTFSYTPTELARNAAAITTGADVDRFDVTVRDGYGGVSVRTVTVDVTSLAVTGAPTVAMATAALSGAAGEHLYAQQDLTSTLSQFTNQQTQFDIPKVADISVQLQKELDAVKAAILKAQLDSELGVTLTDEQRTIIAIKVAALDTADAGFIAPVYAYLDAQALAVAKLSINPLDPTNYVPVLSRIVARTDPASGAIVGTIYFVDRERNSVTVNGSIGTGATFQGLTVVNEDTGQFVFVPTSAATVPRPATLTIGVVALDTRLGGTGYAGVLDYDRRVTAQVLLGPGAGTLAGTSVSVTATTELELRRDEYERAAALRTALAVQTPSSTPDDTFSALLAAIAANSTQMGRF